MTRVLCIALALLPLVAPQDFLWGTFPEGFQWGTATSSHQIEGGWDADGKGVNIWDTFCHDDRFCAGHNGDVACDSYNLWERDIEMVEELEVDLYRFSLSWARILPDGTTDNINQPGIDYYNNLIDGLLEKGIEPIITLYHWDLPQALENEGGWANEEMAHYFREYSRVCFEAFGDRVHWWLTFNEPWVITWLGYGSGVLAPGIQEPATGGYNAAHVLLKAHAEAWHLYDEEYREAQGGQISITNQADWKEPLNGSDPIDVEAADRSLQFQLGWFAHPIFVNGDYPEVMKTQVAAKSEAQGFNESRLPEFTEEEKQRIVGTHDFFGIQHYTTVYIEHFDGGLDAPSYRLDQDTDESRDDDWPTSGSFWLRVVPWGMRNLLNWIREEYDNPPVIITENGVSDRDGPLDDQDRIEYYRDYINNVLKAVELDGCDVRGYFAWSLMDNFEWNMGYEEKFGLYQVDFDDPGRTRTAKESANYYRQIIRDNGFVEPESLP